LVLIESNAVTSESISAPGLNANPEPLKKQDIPSLIHEGQGLVRSLALNVYRTLPIPMDLDDLIAYGQLGLIEAAQAFNHEAGTSFTTFAYYRIRGAIYDGVSKMNWTSRGRLRRMRFQQMADDVLESEHAAASGEPSAEDDAAWLGRVTKRLAIVYLASSNDDAVTKSIAEAVDPHEGPSRVMASREQQETLRKMVESLPHDARRLVENIYFEGYSLTQAAQRCGISKSWASRLHANSLDQLAKNLRARIED
jgi:RNA polymerase sigma factor FliA